MGDVVLTLSKTPLNTFSLRSRPWSVQVTLMKLLYWTDFSQHSVGIWVQQKKPMRSSRTVSKRRCGVCDQSLPQPCQAVLFRVCTKRFFTPYQTWHGGASRDLILNLLSRQNTQKGACLQSRVFQHVFCVVTFDCSLPFEPVTYTVWR